MARIATIGHLSRDVVAGEPPRPGGGVFYSARALAHLGADAQVAASCAAVDRPQLLPPLESFGLPVTWYESATTTSYAFRYEGDRRIMRQEAVGEPWTAARALEAVADAEWIDVCALTRSDFSEETLAALAENGRMLLVDAQGLVRTPALGPLQTDGEIGDTLRHVTILKLNDEEAEALVGSAEPERVRELQVPEVLFTLGSQGSFVIVATGVEHVPATHVAPNADPTGAGDTYSATYLHARSKGAQPVEAAREAAAAVTVMLGAG